MREARVAAGLSQAELGAPYFTRAHVSAIELGKIRPAMRTLEHFARKLGKPASYFLDDAQSSRETSDRALEIDAIFALLTLTGAADALRRAEAALDADRSSVRDLCRLRLAAGAALNLLHRGHDALKHLGTAQRLAAQLRDDRLERAVAYQTAVATRVAGDPRDARRMLEALLDRVVAAKTRDRQLELRTLITLGGCAQDLGEPRAAAAYYERALAWSDDIGDVERRAFVHQGLGNAYRAMGDLDAAAGHFSRALSTAELANDLVAMVVMRNALAVLAADAGRLDAAREHVQRAIEIATVSGPRAYLAHCLVTRAEVALKAKDLALARSSAEDAINAAAPRGAEADRAIASATLVLAEVHAREGDHARAEQRIREAIRRYRALDAKAELGDALMRLSRHAKARGDLSAAERLSAEAYAATRPLAVSVEQRASARATR